MPMSNTASPRGATKASATPAIEAPSNPPAATQTNRGTRDSADVSQPHADQYPTQCKQRDQCLVSITTRKEGRVMSDGLDESHRWA